MNILGTTGISYEIENLIDTANKFIIIVSPYLKINKRLKSKLNECFERCEVNIFIYRKNDLDKNELEWLKGHKKVKLFPVENLHAKCYLNEKRALITSMNLYDYSQINNYELGVVILSENKEEFFTLLTEIKTIISSNYSDLTIAMLEDEYSDFSMGKLYSELTSKYNFPETDNTLDGTYKYFCDIARKIIKFSNDELYQDKTKVLRSTIIRKDDYKKLFTVISKLGKSKK